MRRIVIAVVGTPIVAAFLLGVVLAWSNAAPTPAAATGLVTDISAGADHTCALKDGAVLCWGSNQFGQLGSDSAIDSRVPIAVSDGGGFTNSGVGAIRTGYYHACALKGGGVWCWGRNDYGQLGDGSRSLCRPQYPYDPCSPVPVAVVGMGMGSGVTEISASYGHTCAIKDGGVWCWGWRSNAVGAGFVPVAVVGLTIGVTAISAGEDHTCAIKDGGVWCWGLNDMGQLGDGTNGGPQNCAGNPCSTTPVAVPGLASGVSAISAGSYHTCALKDGGVSCWGWNSHGQLGIGTNQGPTQCSTSWTCSTTPLAVSGMASGVTAISAGSQYDCALKGGGVWCWGYNWAGGLGDNSTMDRYVPVAVVGMASGVTAISAGLHTCALKGGDAWCWGSNGYGELGNNSTLNSHVPVPVASPVLPSDTPTPTPTATPIPVPCSTECSLAGFWHIDFTDLGATGNCSMAITQTVPTSFSNNLSCTIVPLATGTGTIDLVSRAISTTMTFSDGEVVNASGQISPDGNTVTGTWCTPGCGYNGAMTWTRIAASYSAPMTQASGGALSTALGDTLTVPAGALPSDQTITINLEPLPVAPPMGYGSLRTAYDFGPSGLTFNSPVTAVFHYGNGDIPPGVPPENLRIYVLQSGAWSFVGGTVDTVAMTLTVQLSHFSTYGGFAQLSAPVGGIVSGFWSGAVDATALGDCALSLSQTGTQIANVSGSASCTVAGNGTVGGTFNQSTRQLDANIAFTQPAYAVGLIATLSGDENTLSGSWTCACGSGTFSLSKTASQTSTPIAAASGGTLTTSVGDTLTVPAGALATDTTLTSIVQPVPAPAPAGLAAISRGYQFGPDGTAFSIPVFAIFNYTDADLAGGLLDPSTLRVYVYDTIGQQWQLIGGTADTVAKTITVSLDHFSQYALFGNMPAAIDGDGDAVADSADNCPTVSNQSQVNSVIASLSNGPSIPGDDTTDPNENSTIVLGDACNPDPDKDSDGRLDADELAGVSCGGAITTVSTDNTYGGILSPPPGGTSWDTDGDILPDGVECALGTNPTAYGAADRAACVASLASPNGDDDGDGLLNSWEKCKWGSSNALTNTDGDALGDCKEVMDTNGNSIVNASDATVIKQAVFGIIIGDLAAMDINTNGIVNASDATLILQKVFAISPCL